MVHNCSFCDYTSEKLYNVKRHTMRRHKPDENTVVMDNVDNAKNVVNPAKNVVNPAKNVVNFDKNVVNSGVDEENTLKCSQCDKGFDNARKLARHVCKGTHSLQCEICEMIFKDRFAKYYHKKKNNCTPPHPTATHVTNITNNTNNITNNNTTNNTNNIDLSQNIQINYIAFNTPNTAFNNLNYRLSKRLYSG
jgi:uncharacterized C2H2 Zn-finger protein